VNYGLKGTKKSEGGEADPLDCLVGHRARHVGLFTTRPHSDNFHRIDIFEYLINYR